MEAEEVEMTGTGFADAAALESVLRGILPPDLAPFFGASFIRSNRLYDEFIYRLVLQIAREIRLEDAMRTPGTAPEIVARAGLAAGHALVPLDWMLRFLAARGHVEELGDGTAPRYRPRGALPALDPAPAREEQRRHDPSWMPSYVLTETVAKEYPAFLRGEAAGEDVLFSARRLRLWTEYFSNDNGLYAVNNRVAAVAVERWLPRPRAVVLELGGGLGSGALALLEQLDAAGRLDAIAEYRFTEFVTAFLRRGEQTLRARYPSFLGFAFGPLDINRALGEQGVAPGSVSVVYAVNTIHVARDLAFTLGEIYRALAPGGRLVASECVRPWPRQPVHAEFLFNLTETFRSPELHPLYRPGGGFLTPEQWSAAIAAAGFADIRFLPDIAQLRDAAPEFTVAAIGATRPEQPR